MQKSFKFGLRICKFRFFVRYLFGIMKTGRRGEGALAHRRFVMSSSIDRKASFERDAPASGPDSAQTCPNPPNPQKSSQQNDLSLNEKERIAIELLAMGQSYSGIAKQLGIGRRTLFDWRQKESFQQALRTRHREVWGEAADRLRMLVDPSIEVLAEHLNDRYDRARFRAATAVLRFVNIARGVQE
jgi:transposase-like protein